MSINHLGEFFVRFEPLPLEAGAPVVEEAPRPRFAFVVPQLPEGLLEQVSRVQPLVGRQQQFERLLAFQGEVLSVGQQGVFLALDEAPVFAREPRVFGLAHFVQRIAQV